MSGRTTAPFETIESAQEFMELLEESIEAALRDIDRDIEEASSASEDRRLKALVLASYNTRKLADHVSKSRRIMNNLRTLRRLLFNEREGAASLVRAGASK
jgi:hypothetical protein